MGTIFHKPYTQFQQFFNGKELRAVMLGLDCAGKTTILYKLNIGEVVSTVPTIAFNVDTAQFQQVKLMVWDVGGCERLRKIYSPFFQNANAFIFVVDASDKDKIDDARQKLKDVLKADSLNNVPILVFANKQDIQTMSSEQIAQKMGLKKLKGRNWKVQSACGLTGNGLREGFQWLCNVSSKINDNH